MPQPPRCDFGGIRRCASSGPRGSTERKRFYRATPPTRRTVRQNNTKHHEQLPCFYPEEQHIDLSSTHFAPPRVTQATRRRRHQRSQRTHGRTPNRAFAERFLSPPSGAEATTTQTKEARAVHNTRNDNPPPGRKTIRVQRCGRNPLGRIPGQNPPSIHCTYPRADVSGRDPLS